jgi:putative FmdB family regulatory protein
MPTYDFMCKECSKEFSLILTIKEHDEKGFKCPHCNSSEVEQQYSTFYAKTSKKS